MKPYLNLMILIVLYKIIQIINQVLFITVGTDESKKFFLKNVTSKAYLIKALVVFTFDFYFLITIYSLKKKTQEENS